MTEPVESCAETRRAGKSIAFYIVRVSYQARRDDIKSNGFTTLEGRQIYTAGVERIEVEVSD